MHLSLLDTADVTAAIHPFEQLHHHYDNVLTTSNVFLAQDGGDGGGGGIVDIVRNVAIAVTAIVFFLAALTYLSASVIIPAAAKELEQECQELAPELWQEYQQRLEPGQTMAQRPELMQELGAKLQPLLDAKIERLFAERKAQGIDVSEVERAWKAIDKLNQPVQPPPATSTTTGPILDITTTQGQWDDEEEDAGKVSKQRD